MADLLHEPSPVPCFKCGIDLRSFENYEETGVNHPLGGLEFITPGHYGSTVFDSMDGTTLAINICDPCVTTAIGERRVLLYTPQPRIRQPKARAEVLTKQP